MLNISRDSMAGYGLSPATRVFEAGGAGPWLITHAWAGIDLFLETGEEVLIAGSGGDVAALVASLDDRGARRMGEAVRRRVLAERTYAHRAAQVDALLGMRAVA